jgi:dihydroorotase
MARILLTNARVIDPASSTDAASDVLVQDERIEAMGAGLDGGGCDEVVDCSGMMVVPGLIDPHVHLREPGQEHKESIETGTRAAVVGGFTSVVCMPNTSPALDTPARVRDIAARAERGAHCRVFSTGCATVGRQGEVMTDIEGIASAGGVGITDDGDVIQDDAMMRDVLAASKRADIVVMQHCQDKAMTPGSVMHEGAVSVRLGLTGWPREAEIVIIERDIRLAQEIGARYHVQHISAAQSVELIRRARKSTPELITAEATPHHLLCTDEDCQGFNTDAKMNPPLRSAADRAAIVEGVVDGTISVLGTDHAPHTQDEKDTTFEKAAFGIVGLETALALYARALVEPGHIDWGRLIELMTVNAARLCRLDGQGLGSLRVGGVADITIIDPAAEWTIRAEEFVSKGRSMPFEGWNVRGRARGTIVGGKWAWCDGSLKAGSGVCSEG